MAELIKINSSAHADTHAKGGSDELTPSSIGAVEVGESSGNSETPTYQEQIDELKGTMDTKEPVWDGKYDKPATGIPKSDLASAVQTSLGKADSALQSVPSTYRTAAAQDTIDNGKVDKVPSYVLTEASATVDKVISRTGNNLIRFVAIADPHQNNADAQNTTSNMHCGQGAKAILDNVGVDFVSFLGDASWGAYANTVAEVVEQIKTFNGFIADGFRGHVNLRVEGNHDDANYSLTQHPDTPKLSDGAMNAFFYSYNDYRVVLDSAHTTDGYGYMDFDKKKVRVIILNTEQGAGDGGVVTGYQAKWFAEVAMNMVGKTGWQVMVIAHHPLGYLNGVMWNMAKVVEAFINKTTLSITIDGVAISADYTSNPAVFIADFHGHTHDFSIVKMLIDATTEINAWCISIPNACFTRNNQNVGKTDGFERWSTPVTYNKTANSGDDTSFNVITIDTDTQTIWCDNYGAGIDRVQSYYFASYTNLLPISTDASENVYNGTGWKADTKVYNGADVAQAGVNAVGFLPIGDIYTGTSELGHNVLRFKNCELKMDTSTIINLYKADKSYVNKKYGSQTFTDPTTASSIIVELDADNNIVSMDLSKFITYEHNVSIDIAYVRISGPGIDGDTVITINEVIA